MNPSNDEIWRIYFTSAAKIDAKKLSPPHLRNKAEHLLNVIREDPFKRPPPFEQLIGDSKGAYSRRINIQHRLVYQVLTETQSVKICACEAITSRKEVNPVTGYEYRESATLKISIIEAKENLTK